eukprot:Transcript_26262.p1 GENE.Transcript_26262~~Transcript_26262.p1  ORF type:complete len:330 (-),score=91.91 Transcript_26262:54-965(-)
MLLLPPALVISLVPASVRVRIVEPPDLTQLAELCTSALYGEADIWKDGPIAVAQRKQIVQEQRSTLSRRIALEDEAESLFLVAVEPTKYGDRLVGCLDLAVHLFDAQESRFELEQEEMPEGAAEGRYRWAPYMASVAVGAADRRSGVGRQLVQTSEAWAERHGYEEMMLEVSDLNTDAIGFYERGGYAILSSFAEGEAGGGGEVVVRKGLQWEVEPTGKHVMRKVLALRGGRKGGGGGGGGGGKGSGGGGGKGGAGGSKGGGGGGRAGAGQGQGGGNSKAGWPSTTGKPSGGGRSNNPPKQGL